MSSIPIVKTIKAMRGESLTIDLGKTFLGTLTAWMKRDANDLTFRSFSIINNRYLFLSKDKASDYLDGQGLVTEAVSGKWFFDVEQVLDGEDADTVETIYRGIIQFQNDITGSQGIETTDPLLLIANTFISHTDTPNELGEAGQILQMNLGRTALEFINKSIVGFGGTKSQFNDVLSDGNFMFVGDSPAAHTHTFASITSKPTTLSGFGITGTKTQFNTALSNGSFMFLDGVQEVNGEKSFVDGMFNLLNQAKTFGGKFRNTNTANRLYTLQNKDGVIAFISDLPTLPEVQPLNTKGDLYGYGTGIARLPIGAPGQILVPDPAEELGLKWVTNEGGEGGAIKLGDLTDVNSNVLPVNKNVIIGDGNFFGSRQLQTEDIQDYPDTIEAYITDNTIKGLLGSTLNWDVSNVYIGTPITGTVQGQKHITDSYYFEAVNDNVWMRLHRLLMVDDIIDHSEEIEAYITDGTTITKLIFVDNWDIDGVYIGVAITGTLQGQKHFNNAYFFEATNDDQWIRYPRV